MHFDNNIGLADRMIRPTFAIGMITAFATGKVKGAAGIGLLGLATMFIVTIAFGSCPVYQALDVDTSTKK